MVSPFPYRSQKDLFTNRPRPFQVMIVMVLIFTLLVTHPEMMLAIAGTIYSLSAPAEWLVKKVRKQPATELGITEEKKVEAGTE
jgi:phosphatidylserine synthase